MTRLKESREFQRVYRNGKSSHSPLLVLFFLPSPQQITIGFTAGKKVGNAVKRNRAKRRMRALVSSYASRMAPGRYVLVAKAETATAPYAALDKAFETLLHRQKALQ